jgi:hypothetical protein
MSQIKELPKDPKTAIEDTFDIIGYHKACFSIMLGIKLMQSFSLQEG